MITAHMPFLHYLFDILMQAFDGKLVPQDPNDEPAEVLLEKIKKEKETYLALKIKSKKSFKKRRRKNVR